MLTVNRQYLDDFYKRSLEWELTFRGRVEQGLRELSALMGREISDAELATRAGVSPAALSQWLKGTRTPTRGNVEALAKVFADGGLTRYTRWYLESGIREVPPKAPLAKPLKNTRHKVRDPDAAAARKKGKGA